MKNFKLLKDYYQTLPGSGKIVFILACMVAVYLAVEVLS